MEGEDLWVPTGEFLACCDDDKEEAWPALPLVDADPAFGLGLPLPAAATPPPPPPPLEIEDVVGEPTNIGGEGH